MIVTTAFCTNYLPKAITLAKSIKKHMPTAKVIGWLLERSLPQGSEKLDCFDELLLVKDCLDFDLDYYIFRHNILEASTAIKGDLLKYVYRKYTTEDHFLYFDPDIQVFSDFPELSKALESHPIILTPHQLRCVDHYEMEVSSLEHGVYNLGFLGLSRSKIAENLIDWFIDRLRIGCYNEKQIGLFTDQKWFNLVPIFFPETHIFRHAGYNVGPWNLKSRTPKVSGEQIFFDNHPLRFIHFSGHPTSFNNCIENWGTNKKLLYKLSKNYEDMCKSEWHYNFQKSQWSYSKYNSKKSINTLARIEWRSQPPKGKQSSKSPFDLSNQKILGPKYYLFHFFYGFLYRKLKNRYYSFVSKSIKASTDFLGRPK
jgi:hypothetical protein